MRSRAAARQPRAGAPLVSVLLPVRDGGPHLDVALESIVAQTLTDLEIVVVDDGSTDDTPGRLARWTRRDPRVRVFSEPARGIVAALECARAAARGHWLARMDADDVAAPERLARQLARMEADPGLAACGCLIEYFPRSAVRRGARRYERWINSLVTEAEIARDLFVECPIPHPTLFASAAGIDRAGGWRDPGWPEDYDLLFRLWERGGRFAKVPEVLLAWRERPDRLSRTDPRYSPAAFRRCKVHYLRRTLLAGRERVVVWGAGPTGKRFARELQRQGVRIAAFVELDPRKIGKQIHGAPVVTPGDVGLPDGAFCVAAVGQAGARDEIRRALGEAGWREGADFVAIA